MKKLILFLLFIPLLFSFSTSTNSINKLNNDLALFQKYEFTITINGEVHKVKASTFSGVPSGYGYWPGNPSQLISPNMCVATNFGIEKTVWLAINDVTARNYVSGQNIACTIVLSNLLLGVNQAKTSFDGVYFDTLSEKLGSKNFNFQTVSGVPDDSQSGKLPISITDLGKAPYIDRVRFYSFNETIKGNYSGTIYLKNKIDGNFTIPVKLSIDFKALRYY